MKRLTFDEVKDILVGCTILSTGGGGDLNKGLKMIKEDFENNLEYKLISLEEKGNYSKYTKINKSPTVIAVQALERYFQEELSGMVSIEYGGMNTAVAMSTAARLNKFIVDADAAGRAVPDLYFLCL